jgi:SNF family Na+-dependent transporter
MKPEQQSDLIDLIVHFIPLDIIVFILKGGGVFLIPYFIFLILIGIPLVLLEMSVGQFTSTGPLTSWRMTPLFRGIGLSMNIVNGYLCLYYNMILAYSLYFLYHTFASIGNGGILPWQYCNTKWSSASNKF